MEEKTPNRANKRNIIPFIHVMRSNLPLYKQMEFWRSHTRVNMSRYFQFLFPRWLTAKPLDNKAFTTKVRSGRTMKCASILSQGPLAVATFFRNPLEHTPEFFKSVLSMWDWNSLTDVRHNCKIKPFRTCLVTFAFEILNFRLPLSTFNDSADENKKQTKRKTYK